MMSSPGPQARGWQAKAQGLASRPPRTASLAFVVPGRLLRTASPTGQGAFDFRLGVHWLEAEAGAGAEAEAGQGEGEGWLEFPRVPARAPLGLGPSLR